MQYFQAVKIGKERASKSQMKLFKFGGFGMLTITTKNSNFKDSVGFSNVWIYEHFKSLHIKPK